VAGEGYATSPGSATKMVRMHRRRYALVPVALALTAASVTACSGGDDDESADDTLAAVTTMTGVTTTTTPATTPATTEAPPTTDAPTTPPTEPAPTEPAPTEPPTTPPATETPVTTVAPSTTVAPAAVVLARDGLGVVPFGTDADGAVAAITAVLGPPTEDTGWVDPLTISTCAGTELRRVSWGALAILLGDPAATGTGVRQFFASSYGNVAGVEPQPAGLRTPEGIGLGASVAELKAAYPGVVLNPGEEGLIEPSFYVDDNLRGIVTGDTDTDSVTVVFGGPFCG
jgi:hypothetical protein